MIEVKLTPDELYQAAAVGAHRRITCIFNRHKQQHYDSPKGDEWATEIESCCAEIAVAKFLNKYWSGGVFDGSRAEFDVDGRQVRHTPYHSGCLIIYPEDDPNSKYVLVTGKAPDYKVRGWVIGGEVQRLGKEHEYWTQPPNKLSQSWWVPQTALRRIPSK